MTRGAGGTLSLTRGPGALTHSPPPQSRLGSLLEGHLDDLVLEMGGSGAWSLGARVRCHVSAPKVFWAPAVCPSWDAERRWLMKPQPLLSGNAQIQREGTRTCPLGPRGILYAQHPAWHRAESKYLFTLIFFLDFQAVGLLEHG